jgi:hypothetical protein
MLAADWLLKRVNMMCLAFCIRLETHYFIRSLENCVSDFLSQELEWSFQNTHRTIKKRVLGTSDADVLDLTLSHWTSCRVVLHRALVRDEPIAVTELYATLMPCRALLPVWI